MKTVMIAFATLVALTVAVPSIASAKGFHRESHRQHYHGGGHHHHHGGLLHKLLR